MALAGLAVAIVVATVALTTPPRPAGNAVRTDATVVATLQPGRASYPAGLQASLRAARAAPGDASLAKAAARDLIREGRGAGDTRLVGAALGILRPAVDAGDPDALYLAATARQYQHDFTGALALLNRALIRDPRHADALLTRATLHIVLGQFDTALADCDRLARLPQPQVALLCSSTALLLTARAPAVYARLRAILAQPGLLDPGLRGWATGLMGEIAALDGRTDAAQAYFAEVIAADPLALRERLMLADLLLAQNDGSAVMTLLAPAPEVDGVLLRRALAATLLGDAAVHETARAELDRRFRLNLDLGLTAHAREEARYFLEIADDPVLALARAQVNWDLQHEFEDAQLLIDAAVAADAPAAAAPVLRWMAEQSVVVPAMRIPDAVRRAAE